MTKRIATVPVVLWVPKLTREERVKDRKKK